MSIWADFKSSVSVGSMDWTDVSFLLQLQSSNKAYRVIKLMFDEKTTGEMSSGMTTDSVFELKYNDKFYKETEKIVNKYTSGNLDLSSQSKVNTNIEW